MSNAISPLAALQSVDPAGARGNVKSGADFAAAPTTGSPPTSSQTPPFSNPSFQIDGPLGILVMQFHDSSGRVESTIPTARQIEAYRLLGHVPAQAAHATAAAAGHAGHTGHGSTANGAPAPAVSETSAIGNGTPETGATGVIAPAIAVAASAAVANVSAPLGASASLPSPAGVTSVR